MCIRDSNRCAPGTYETWSKTLAHVDKLVATVGDGHWTADQATAVMNTYSDGYVLLAAFASLLLIVPFVALAGSAARLAASRRDAPVSYTHLTRNEQVDSSILSSGSTALDVRRFSEHLGSVSYTHLDVYKRQFSLRAFGPRVTATAPERTSSMMP